MSLTKCSECGKEISDKAKACPSCGNPASYQPAENIKNKNVSTIESTGKKWKRTIFDLLILFLVIGGYFFLQHQSSIYSGSGTFIGDINQSLSTGNYKRVFEDITTQQTNPTAKKLNEISLQEINNLGYTFYLGQIDTSNTAIGDDLKTQITKIIYDAKFPKSLLKNIPIVIVNSLAIKPDSYISTQNGNIAMMNFGPNFLYEGGIYAVTTTNNAIIFINKTTLEKGLLVDVLTHELGHAIGHTLTDNDWKKYYGLRNIPTGTERDNGLWNLSPQEDFAEVYKNIFTGFDLKTYYGLLVPTNGLGGDIMASCYKIYEKIYQSKIEEYEKENTPINCRGNKNPQSMECVSYLYGFNTSRITTGQMQKAEDFANSNREVQTCRRNIMSNPEKYPDDFRYGIPYKSSVGPKTKEFINMILARIN